ncbi:glycosyltransferase family 4 protein [Ferrimonas marina]|uniref:Glycosyltransferase involved in cell wall bisynthesis n=1 Tax=Ferrimonas marina TaxID=299255 RepID=A0A1M5ZR19_9GAMM|nr:glycosyltransferase family 4 protein [Ferrimonas marina]SHI26536.1 Glycosyltransferase involved in cell wall bisynthesis [Ferrimonas marina]
MRTAVALVGGRGFHSAYGGVENAVHQLSREMARQGTQPIWVAGHGEGRGFQRSQSHGVHLLSAPKWVTALGHSATTLVVLLYLLIWVRPQVVFLFASGPSLLSPLVRLFGARAVACLRAIDSQRDGWRGLNKWILQAGEYAATHWAHCCTVNSLAMQRHFQAKGIETVFIANGITTPERFEPGYLESLALTADHYLLYAARLDPVKRLDLLLQAHSAMAAPPLLVVAGGNCKSPAYEARLRQLAHDKVLFLGHVDQAKMATLMQGCGIFVLPSVLEGMSNSLLSAMGQGRCVLCADVPENADVVEGVPEALFPADNRSVLTERLEQLWQDPLARAEVGEALKRRSRQFDWAESASRFLILAQRGGEARLGSLSSG